MSAQGHVAVLGAGSWGTALALTALVAGHELRLWARRGELAREIQGGNNSRYLPGVKLPPSLNASDDLEGTLDGAAMIILALPCSALRDMGATLASRGGAIPPVVCAAKGLERPSGRRPSELLTDHLGSVPCVLLGPSHAEEVAQGLPTAVVLSGGDPTLCEQVQQQLSVSFFRIYTNDDLVGVELAAALKNVLAIAAGICDGLGLGDNTKGALLTRGVAEIARLGAQMGAQRDTFFGLAGIGDVITTCLSQHSRNRALGEMIGKGESLEEALSHMSQVVEGAETAATVSTLASRYEVSMPIGEQVRRVLFEGHDPRRAIEELMGRSLKSESEGRAAAPERRQA